MLSLILAGIDCTPWPYAAVLQYLVAFFFFLFFFAKLICFVRFCCTHTQVVLGMWRTRSMNTWIIAAPPSSQQTNENWLAWTIDLWWFVSLSGSGLYPGVLSWLISFRVIFYFCSFALLVKTNGTVGAEFPWKISSGFKFVVGIK